MDFYKKNDAIALAILREWASIAALKAIPFPVSSAPLWDRWLEEIEKDDITTYEGITDEEFAMYFGGRRTYARFQTFPDTFWLPDFLILFGYLIVPSMLLKGLEMQFRVC